MEKVLPFFDKDETAHKIREVCKEEGVDFDTFEELVGEEFRQLGKARKRGQTEVFDDILIRIYEDDLE